MFREEGLFIDLKCRLNPIHQLGIVLLSAQGMEKSKSFEPA